MCKVSNDFCTISKMNTKLNSKVMVAKYGDYSCSNIDKILYRCYYHILTAGVLKIVLNCSFLVTEETTNLIFFRIFSNKM